MSFTTLDTINSLAESLSGNEDVDFTIDEATLSQASVKVEKAPNTLAEAGDLLPIKVSSTTVGKRIKLISAELNIPLDCLAKMNGDRLSGLTDLGWTILKGFPHEKGEARENYLDWVDTHYDRFFDKDDKDDAPVVEVWDSEEVSSDDFTAIVQRKINNLSVPVHQAVIASPFSGAEFSAFQALARKVGEQIGQSIVAQMGAGINAGIEKGQDALRADMLQTLGGVE